MNKMKLAIVLCGCLISGVAAAAPKFDRNGDGSLDATEKTQRHEAMKAKRLEMKAQVLAKFDVNKDGKLDQTERATMKETIAIEAFKRLDTDGNGSLSLAEFKQGKRFTKHFGKRHMRRGHNKVR